MKSSIHSASLPFGARSARALVSSASTLLLAAFLARGAATYSTEDGGATLVVDVDPDGATLDASQVVAGVTKIAKRGSGKLTSVDISSYTGDFDIEDGIWCCTDAKQFGATSTTASSGTIWVRDGASIEYAGTNAKPSTMSGKTVHLYGSAASGASGKVFLSTTAQMADPGFGKNLSFVLHDDATFYSRNRLCMIGTYDLGGKTLTFAGGSGKSHDVCGTFTNGGHIVIASGTTWMSQAAAFVFAAECADEAYVEIEGGATFNIKDKVTAANGWTVKNNGGVITCNTQRMPTTLNIGVWAGPIELSGNTALANYGNNIGGWGISNTVLNIEGPLSGNGTLLVGPGWLNLHDAVNTYSGPVTVRGRGLKRTPGNNNENVVPPGAGGIGVWNGAPVFPNATSITLKDSARVEFMDNVAATVGALMFVGDKSTFTSFDPGDDTQSIKGGIATARSTIAGLTKTGTNTLVVSSPAHFTGKATVSEGTLKIPYLSTKGTPGLVAAQATPKTVDTWSDIAYIFEPTPAYYKVFTPWNASYLAHCNVTEKGISVTGAERIYKGMINTGSVAWDDGYGATLTGTIKSKRNAWWYSGYVWNNTDAPATYTVWTGSSYGSAIWLGEDHSTSIQLKIGADNTQHGKPPADAQEITLQPGATKIDIVVVGEQSHWCYAVPSNGERYGLVYAPTSVCTAEALNNLIIDYYDNPSAATTNALSAALHQFSEFKDTSGVGELFTTDVYGAGDADKMTAMQPVFDDLAFAYGTTLDLSDNLAFQVKNLTGSPMVVDVGTFGVTNNWTLLAADFPAADSNVRHPMTVDGALAFAEGSTFSIDNPAAMTREATIVATTTDGITGVPAPAEGLDDWRLIVDGNNLLLKKVNYSILIFR